MKKSQFRVIELFVYAVLVGLAIVYAVRHGGFYAPGVTAIPPAMPPISMEETQTTEEKHMNDPALAPSQPPPYNPPPKGEYRP